MLTIFATLHFLFPYEKDLLNVKQFKNVKFKLTGKFNEKIKFGNETKCKNNLYVLS